MYCMDFAFTRFFIMDATPTNGYVVTPRANQVNATGVRANSARASVAAMANNVTIRSSRSTVQLQLPACTTSPASSYPALSR